MLKIYSFALAFFLSLFPFLTFYSRFVQFEEQKFYSNIFLYYREKIKFLNFSVLFKLIMIYLSFLILKNSSLAVMWITRNVSVIENNLKFVWEVKIQNLWNASEIWVTFLKILTKDYNLDWIILSELRLNQ